MSRQPLQPPASLQIALLLVASLTIMAGTIVAPALPAIRNAFAGEAHVELLSRMVLTLPALFVAACAPIVGLLGDRFGRRRLLIFLVLLYAAAGTSGLYADSLTGLLIGRAVLGVAVGGIMTLGAALVGDHFEGAQRERFFGLQQAATQFGGVVFVVAGGQLADIGWRAPFAVYGLALVIAPIAMVCLTEGPGARSRSAVQSAPSRANWRFVGGICLTAFLVNMLFYTVPAQIGFFLAGELGLSQPSTAGWAIGVLNLAGAVTALNYVRVRQRWDVTRTFALCFTLMSVGYLGLSLSTTAFAVFAALIVLGCGLGLAMPNILSATVQGAAPAIRARAAGLVTSAMFLGHFVSPIASQPLIRLSGYRGLYLAVAASFAIMLLVLMLWKGATRATGAERARGPAPGSDQ